MKKRRKNKEERKEAEGEMNMHEKRNRIAYN